MEFTFQMPRSTHYSLVLYAYMVYCLLVESVLSAKSSYQLKFTAHLHGNTLSIDEHTHRDISAAHVLCSLMNLHTLTFAY